MLASIPNLITHTRLPIMRRSSSCKASPPGNQSMIGNSTCEEIIVRRTANYHPPIWDYDYVQSLRSDYVQSLRSDYVVGLYIMNIANRLILVINAPLGITNKYMVRYAGRNIHQKT